MSITVADFFSGCGGTCAGFRGAGLDLLLALDNDRDARSTFEVNFPGTPFICRDIRNVAPTDIEYLVLNSRGQGKTLLFSACAPCQPFSIQRRNRRRSDERYPLLLEFLRFVWYFRPELVFLENVPGVDQVYGSVRPFATCLDTLRSNGYSVEHRVINCWDYGIPQRRRRLLLVASRLGPIRFPEPSHGPGTASPEYPKVRDWISDLPRIEAGETHPDVPNHRASTLSELNLRRIRATPAESTRVKWPEELVLECHKNGHRGHTDVYGRLRWDEPATAITTRCISLSNGRFGHPEQDRALSIREAACLQTFDRDFIFTGSMNSMARQVGNAVPVLLAKHVGEHFLRHVAEYKK